MPARSLPLLAALLCLALLAAPAAAAPELEPVASFASPTFVTSPPGDARLFVTERAGVVRIVGKDGAVKPRPFLDITSHTTTVGERGLLSIAFPPDYTASGLAYIFVTGVDGTLQIREIRRSASDPNRAEPGIGRLVLSQEHSRYRNHNGGQVQFGSDGLLYAGFGDGGSGNDPNRNGQSLDTLLGKLIRIDPRKTADGAPYAVPADNPFVAPAPGRDEIWAYGLRNPYRFSFDRLTGDLWLGDVGQDAREEVDHAAAGVGGQNYGWRCYEGTIPTPTIDVPCEPVGHVPPLFDLDQETDIVCSITGGYVARDPGLPTLSGRYLYGDVCRPEIQSASADGEPGTATGLSVDALVSFGQDACARLYTVSLSGPVSRIHDGAATPCDLPEAPTPPAGPQPPPAPPAGSAPTPATAAAAADRAAPRLSVRRSARQRVRGGRAVKLTVAASEAATVSVALRIPGRGDAALRVAHAARRDPRDVPGRRAGRARKAHPYGRHAPLAPRVAHGDRARCRRERVARGAPGPPALAVEQLLRLGLQRLAHDPAARGIALRQRLREVLGLLELDVRRQRRHLGIDDRLDDDRPVGGQGPLPGRRDLVRRIDADALEAEQLGVARVREVGDDLGGEQLGIARQHALLPGDLVEVLVVEHEQDEARVAPAIAVLRHVYQRADPVHLHRPVALDRDHRSVGVDELRRHRVGQRRAHRGQRAREHAAHPAAEAQVARVPVGARSPSRR